MRHHFFLRLLILVGLLLPGYACSPSSTPVTPASSKARAYRELGVAYMQKNDFTSALREFLKSEKLNPDDPYLQDYMGLTYAAKKRYDLAIEHFNKALSIKPDYTAARNNLGNIYLYKEEWDTAIEIFKEVTEDLIYATPHFPLSNIGYAYYHKEEYQLAESYYQQALDLAPHFVRAQNGLGKTYIAMGKGRKALDILKQAIKQAPETPELYYSLGEAYQLTGNREKAQEAFKKVIRLKTDSELAKAARKKLDRIRQPIQW